MNRGEYLSLKILPQVIRDVVELVSQENLEALSLVCNICHYRLDLLNAHSRGGCWGCWTGAWILVASGCSADKTIVGGAVYAAGFLGFFQVRVQELPLLKCKGLLRRQTLLGCASLHRLQLHIVLAEVFDPLI